jgi:hypothetical protein
MKFTKISSDNAYKLYKEGKAKGLYFLPYDTTQYLSIPRYYNFARQWFREREIFIGKESPKITVRQQVELHCTKGSFFIREDVLKMIYSEHSEAETQFPKSEKFSGILDKARERTTKYILFDIDSDGEKSNFRFE